VRFTDRSLTAEYLPPGHPVTHDIELDIDSRKRTMQAGEGAR
jgi:acetophenone carboxylase